MQFEIKYPEYTHNLPFESQNGTDVVVADETDVASITAQLAVNLREGDSITVTRY